MNKKDTYIITITVRSPKGVKPEVRTLCGDTVFINMKNDQTARWTIKKVKQ